MTMVDAVQIREVGLRDGLQLIGKTLPTECKVAWIRRQAEAGFAEIEATSFVPPSVLPQFADAAEVLRAANEIDGLLASVLVPNLKGALRALDAGARKVTFVLSASEAHNRSNVRCSTDESVAMFRALCEERKKRGLEDSVYLVGVIATAFGCTIQGRVDRMRVVDLARQLVDAGADEVNIADTVGYADPESVRKLFTALGLELDPVPLAAHFHDTRGMGLANVCAALGAGIRRFDASLGGLGGCPFAPGATGNIATEDCVYMLESMGFDTGVDVDRTIGLREQLGDWLPGENLRGNLMNAGVAKTFRSSA